MNIHHTMMLTFLLLGSGLIGVACSTSVEPDSLDATYYTIHSAEARAWVGSDTIARRAEETRLDRSHVEGLRFSRYTDEEVEVQLRAATARVLGDAARDAQLTDHGNTLALDLGTGSGSAWVARDTGAFSVKVRDYARGSTVVVDAGDAVDRALAHLAATELVRLATGETLDVVGVTSTHHAGWSEVDGERVAVQYLDERSGEHVTQFKSEYTVYFGRRYRGVPVVGPTLGVKLDAEGQLAGVMKLWRDVEGDVDGGVALVDGAELDSRRSLSLDSNPALTRATCGYVESSAIGYRQDQAGVGCQFFVEDPAARGTLAQEIDEWVDLTAGDQIPLHGERVER